MNAEQFKGKWMPLKGELKRQWGQFTDDDLQRIEGNFDKFAGMALERYGEKKDEVMKWVDQWIEQCEPGQSAMKSKRRSA
jgi:uncharacterized protein YjbJ (UPF0337 family)